MKAVTPVLSNHTDSRLVEVSVAESQPEYQTPPAIIFRSPEGPATLTRWEFTTEDLERIARGDNLFLEVLGGMVPVKLYIATPQEVFEAITAEDMASHPLIVSNQTS